VDNWAPDNTEDWVRREVGDGVAALIVLRLKNPPAEDTIELTLDVWLAAIGQKVSVEALDAPRIREGFRRLFAKTKEWPAPFQVIELMPRRKPVPAITHEISDKERSNNRERIREIARSII
jgi:hypothetical protein